MSANDMNSQYWGSRCLAEGSGAPSQGGCASGDSVHQDDQAESRTASSFANGVSGSAAESSAQSQQTQQVYASYPPASAYRSDKNRIVAGLLAIFLGSLGIHKFYLGYNSAGFIMLAVTIIGSIFTLGLAGMVMQVIGIVEGIIYLTQDQQAFDRTYAYGSKEWF